MSDQRSISLSVLTDRPALADHVYDVFLEYGKELKPLKLDYVNINICKTDDFETEEDPTIEGEYADENTILLVRTTLAETKLFGYEGWNAIEDCIAALQNAGILFRQKR